LSLTATWIRLKMTGIKWLWMKSDGIQWGKHSNWPSITAWSLQLVVMLISASHLSKARPISNTVLSCNSAHKVKCAFRKAIWKRMANVSNKKPDTT
jgi:hypothetical protein